MRGYEGNRDRDRGKLRKKKLQFLPGLERRGNKLWWQEEIDQRMKKRKNTPGCWNHSVWWNVETGNDTEELELLDSRTPIHTDPHISSRCPTRHPCPCWFCHPAYGRSRPGWRSPPRWLAFRRFEERFRCWRCEAPEMVHGLKLASWRQPLEPCPQLCGCLQQTSFGRSGNPWWLEMKCWK